jgi:hypothetical protein
MRTIAAVATLGLVLIGSAVPAFAENDVITIVGTVDWSDAQNGYLWASRCRIVAVAQDSGTSNSSFTGAVAGAAVAVKPGTGELASTDLHCQVKVSGGTVVSGGNGATNGVDADAGQVTFSASDADYIEICIALPGITASTQCAGVERSTTPPGAAQNLVDDTVRLANDVLCPVLKSLAPIVVSTVFALEPDGDITVLGTRVYDCPPLGS